MTKVKPIYICKKCGVLFQSLKHCPVCQSTSVDTIFVVVAEDNELIVKLRDKE